MHVLSYHKSHCFVNQILLFWADWVGAARSLTQRSSVDTMWLLVAVTAAWFYVDATQSPVPAGLATVGVARESGRAGVAAAQQSPAATAAGGGLATYSDIRNGFCTGPNGQRPQTFLCDTTGGRQGCPTTSAGCAKVCTATASCTGYMTQAMAPDPSTCNLVSAQTPSGSGTWRLGQPGAGLQITGHDTETRDHCYKRAMVPPAPSPAGTYDNVGQGYCVSATGRRPETWLCDGSGCPKFSQQAFAALCNADATSAGFMIQTMATYHQPPTCIANLQYKCQLMGKSFIENAERMENFP